MSENAQSPDSAEAAPLAAPQQSAAQNVVKYVKDVASDPINLKPNTLDSSTQTNKDSDVARSTVAYKTRQRSAHYNELTSTVRDVTSKTSK